MAQSGTTVKARIERKIFNAPPASTITIRTLTRGDGEYGGYGGTTRSYGNAASTVGVPYGFISGERRYEQFGFNAEGESLIAVKADTTVAQGDLVYISAMGLLGEVLDIKEYPYNDVNLAKIIKIKEVLEIPVFEASNFVLQDGNNFVFQDGSNFIFN